ncbi:MAG: L,D-transpeptidase [Acidimicrobiales bacterium]
MAVIALALITGSHSAFGATKEVARHPLSSPRAPSITLAAVRTDSAVSSKATIAPEHSRRLRVRSITPSPGSRSISYMAAFEVRFSGPIAANSRLPRFVPPLAGRWTGTATDVLAFHPRGNSVPFATERLVVPGGRHGIKAFDGATLAATVKATFTVAPGSLLRLQQLLAELGYLPLRFVPTGSAGSLSSARAHRLVPKSSRDQTVARGSSSLRVPKPGPTKVEGPTVADEIPLNPVSGKFSWRFPHTPRSLAALWSKGRPNVITTGALMQFEAAHSLPTDGTASADVWKALLHAFAHRRLDKAPYAYVYVSMSTPETLSLWVDGKVVFRTLCNTGIPVSPTAIGTWPVYLRYVTTTMSGINPNGTPYDDTGIPWVSYFNGGDALHGFIRSQYGFPQSLGCVEMPFASAGAIYPWTPIGTLVTIL